MEVAVIGAGVAGLAAAWAIRKAGQNATLYEAGVAPGGLLAPIKIKGFTFDTAVHLSFASEPVVREIFDKVEYFTHVPESRCWDQGYWLKHPAQTNMFPLPLEEKVKMIAGLAESKEGVICNYEDWLVQQYGEPIARRWPIVYTDKYWTVPAARLGTKWIGQRMRKADLNEVIAGALSPETPNQYYVKEMRYPVKGGYSAFIQPLVEGATVKTNHRAIEIRPCERQILFQNGAVKTYDRLISTMPLPSLIEAIEDVPDSIRKDAESLFATSIDLISVGFRRRDVSPALWFYIYDRDVLAARAYSPDRKSVNNVPEGCSALQFEIYSSREKPQTHSVAALKENTLRGVVAMGLATEDDVIFAEHTHVPYANVVFDIGMEERRDRVRDWVRGLGMEIAGRFGEWDYLWSNQSFVSGTEAGERIIASCKSF